MNDLPQNERAVSGSNSGIEAGHLMAFIERIENIEERIAEEQDTRKEVYAEAKSVGFDVSVIREIVKIRKQDADKRREKGEILDLYCAAIGMEV